MKKICLIAYILILSVASISAAGEQGFNIKVTLDDVDKLDVSMGYYFGDKMETYEKVKIKCRKNSCEIKGKKNLATGVYFIKIDGNVFFEFLGTSEYLDVSFSSSYEDIILNMVITGSEENEVFYNGYVIPYNRHYRKLKVTPIEQQPEIVSEIQQIKQTFVDKHPSTFSGHLVQSTILPDISEIADRKEQFTYYKEHYFDNINFKDARLLRSPGFHNRIISYLDKFTTQHPDSIIKAVDRILKLALNGSFEMYQYFAHEITSKYEKSALMGADKVFVHCFDRYLDDAEWIDDKTKIKLAEKVEKLRPSLLGKVAFDLPGMDIHGNGRKLHKIAEGHSTIIIFLNDSEQSREYIKEHGETIKGLADLYQMTTVVYTNDPNLIHDIELPAFTVILANPSVEDYPAKYYDVHTYPVIYVLNKKMRIIGKKLNILSLKAFLKQS